MNDIWMPKSQFFFKNYQTFCFYILKIGLYFTCAQYSVGEIFMHQTHFSHYCLLVKDINPSYTERFSQTYYTEGRGMLQLGLGLKPRYPSTRPS